MKELKNEDLVQSVIISSPSPTKKKIASRARELALKMMYGDNHGYYTISLADILADLIFCKIEGWNSLSREEIENYIETRREYRSKSHVYGT